MRDGVPVCVNEFMNVPPLALPYVEALLPLSIDGGVTFRPLASPPFCFVSAPVSSTTTRPLTPRPPEPLFLHAPRRAPQAIYFRLPLALQAM